MEHGNSRECDDSTEKAGYMYTSCIRVRSNVTKPIDRVQELNNEKEKLHTVLRRWKQGKPFDKGRRPDISVGRKDENPLLLIDVYKGIGRP